MTTAIALLQLCILFIYIFYIKDRFGTLPSISESTYRLSRRSRYYFTGALWSVAFLNYLQPMEMYGAVASAGLFFTGVTISFKSTSAHTNLVHYIGALTAIISSIIGLIVLYNLWFVPIIILIVSCLLSLEGNFIWWFEIISIASIIGSYIII